MCNFPLVYPPYLPMHVVSCLHAKLTAPFLPLLELERMRLVSAQMATTCILLSRMAPKLGCLLPMLKTPRPGKALNKLRLV
jgi:hypothetical protein